MSKIAIFESAVNNSKVFSNIHMQQVYDFP